MSDLKRIEKRKIEKLFDMESGYVLYPLTNAEFYDIVFESTNLDIFDEKYQENGNSKARRLRNFWKKESNYIVGKLLKDLLKYWLEERRKKDVNRNFSCREEANEYEYEEKLYKESLKTAEKLIQNNPVQSLKTSNIEKIDHFFIQEHIKKCNNKISDEDYSGAITNARSLVETILLHIKFELFKKYEKFNGDLKALYKEISKELHLSVNKKTENSFKVIISGLFSIISGIAELGNDLGDRHGKDKRSYITEKHHAILVVNSAQTFSEFIFSSFEKQKLKNVK